MVVAIGAAAAVSGSAMEVTASDARLVWMDPEFVVAQGLEPWTEPPVWVPHDDVEMGALHTSDVTRALDWGLRVRPLRETVSDTWDWLRAADPSGDLPDPRLGLGVEPGKENGALAAWAALQAGRK